MGTLPSGGYFSFRGIAKGAMDKPSLSEPALRRIKAVQLEAGADLLNDLDAYWRGIGRSTEALTRHDPSELMPLFERYAEKLFDAEAREWLACFSDPDAYTRQVIFVPLTIVTRICPTVDTIPELFPSTDWKDLYRVLKERAAKSGGKTFLGQLGRLSGDWEKYLDHSFSRRFLKGRIKTVLPDIDAGVKNFRALFRMKYLFHLRLLANKHLFIQRLRAHLSVQLQAWRAQAYRQLADTLAPPVDEALLVLPQAAGLAIPRGEASQPSAPRKRGPKPGHETAARVAEITATLAKDSDWKDKLEEICAAMDKAELPFPKTWPKREVPMNSWEDGAMIEPALAKKAIEHLLKLAKQRKKAPPETLS
jgi:hypothetical protein